MTRAQLSILLPLLEQYLQVRVLLSTGAGITATTLGIIDDMSGGALVVVGNRLDNSLTYVAMPSIVGFRVINEETR